MNWQAINVHAPCKVMDKSNQPRGHDLIVATAQNIDVPDYTGMPRAKADQLLMGIYGLTHLNHRYRGPADRGLQAASRYPLLPFPVPRLLGPFVDTDRRVAIFPKVEQPNDLIIDDTDSSSLAFAIASLCFWCQPERQVSLFATGELQPSAGQPDTGIDPVEGIREKLRTIALALTKYPHLYPGDRYLFLPDRMLPAEDNPANVAAIKEDLAELSVKHGVTAFPVATLGAVARHLGLVQKATPPFFGRLNRALAPLMIVFKTVLALAVTCVAVLAWLQRPLAVEPVTQPGIERIGWNSNAGFNTKFACRIGARPALLEKDWLKLSVRLGNRAGLPGPIAWLSAPRGHFFTFVSLSGQGPEVVPERLLQNGDPTHPDLLNYAFKIPPGTGHRMLVVVARRTEAFANDRLMYRLSEIFARYKDQAEPDRWYAEAVEYLDQSSVGLRAFSYVVLPSNDGRCSP